MKQTSQVICNLKQAQLEKNGKFLLKNIIFDAHPEIFSSCQLSSKYKPPTNWPSQDRIIFDNVSMPHSEKPNSLLARHHISLIIEPSEKIDIVRRTGAGKSSFIQTLFRIGTLVNSHITIDNIDIATIELDYVRRCISIIPQDPGLFY
ncbi:unnamed protein product [Rotaria sp. Silwood1]|nr:unnamed protein product [Rotaria sp. Silwood1]CAF1369695.1 unnamed protein product [Rotaria sp. Silwood1]CAF3545486.1 unnamed protein product [Rotaria sp. Silwood1]CAF3560834.1 unnamed protein product [Rotaria sp. Silwood1]CAF3572162.1 unnamed protein product [Rotaria sp. Silwood1]